MTNIWHLSHVDWLEELTDDERLKLRSSSTPRSYERSETVFAPSPDPHSVYLLEDGLVRIFRISETGSEATLGYVQPGEVFGELAAFGDYPRESFAEAVVPSRVWRMQRKTFSEILHAKPSIVLPIARQVGERLKRVENRVEDLVFRDVGSRLASALLELGESLGRRDGEGTVIQAPLTQSDLATLIGSTRQSVNVALRELEEAGLIEREGKQIRVLQAEELRRVGQRRPPQGS